MAEEDNQNQVSVEGTVDGAAPKKKKRRRKRKKKTSTDATLVDPQKKSEKTAKKKSDTKKKDDSAKKGDSGKKKTSTKKKTQKNEQKASDVTESAEIVSDAAPKKKKRRRKRKKKNPAETEQIQEQSAESEAGNFELSDSSELAAQDSNSADTSGEINPFLIDQVDSGVASPDLNEQEEGFAADPSPFDASSSVADASEGTVMEETTFQSEAEPSPFDAAPAAEPAAAPSPFDATPAVEPAAAPSPFDAAPAVEPAAAPSPFDATPAVEPAAAPSPFDATPAVEPAAAPSPFDAAPATEPAVAPSPFDAAPAAEPAAEPAAAPSPFDVAPAAEPAAAPSPFDAAPATEPAAAPSPFDAAPAAEPAAAPSPFDAAPAAEPAAAPSPFDVAPAVEPAAAPSPFDAAPATDPAVAPSPFDAAPAAEPAAAPSPFDAAPAAEPAAAPSPFDVALAAEPAAAPSPFDAPASDPIEPMDDDEEDDFDEPSLMPPSKIEEASAEMDAPIEAEVVSTSTEKVESEVDAVPETDFSLPDDKAKAKTNTTDGFWASLDELGLSKGKILKTCASLVVLVVLTVAFFSFGGLDMFSSDSSQETSTETAHDETNKEKDEKPVNSVDQDPNGTETSQLFGKNQGAKTDSNVPTPVKVANVVGEIQSGPYFWRAGLSNASVFGFPTFKDRIGGDYRILTAVDLLRKIQNAYATDIHALVDATPDRSVALENHINKLKDFYNEAKEMRLQIEREVAIIRATFDSLAPQKEAAEKAYFANLNALQPDGTANGLKVFIELSKEMIDLKARFKALERLYEHYSVTLKKLRARIRDLQENREAIVKGVKVYDVPRSDIQLIVPVELDESDDDL